MDEAQTIGTQPAVPVSHDQASSAAALKESVLARLSIEHKLPLLIGALLLVVVTALCAAAYVEARSTAIRIAEARLTSVVVQLRDVFQSSSSQLRARAWNLALQADVVEYSRTRAARLRTAARAALAYTGPQGEQAMGTELRNGAGEILLNAGPTESRLEGAQSVSPLLSWSRQRDSVTIGRLRLLGDTIAYPIVAPIAGADAYVVHWRRLAVSRRTREMMTQLIGSEASIFLGNANLNLWTDLERAVAMPPIDTALVGSLRIQGYERASHGAARSDSSRPTPAVTEPVTHGRYVAAASSIPGTPWIVAVDFPYDVMLAPARDFLRRLTVIAAFALALGMLAAWVVSRRISRPLHDLTDAAVSVSSGNFSRAPHIDRSDELGRLGRAFATMASEVQSARDDLERKVELRTRDLNDTLYQLHEAQDALVRREKLAFLGQLASGVGHELRNPLGVMTNAVYYLKTVLRGQPANVQEYLDIVQQQITLSEKIIGDLLDFARSKSPRRQPADLSDIVEAQLARLGAAPGIAIETEMEKQLPQVRVDPVQIGQIILNLLTNAVQSIDGAEGERGGRIMVRGCIAGDSVQCEVSDNGAGIARENLEKIFEPLFTTKARGIGLGLAVSRQLARANQGDLTVSSTPGQGATFRLWLPVATGSPS